MKEEMMDVLVVYDSQYGNTERIARAIADTMSEFGQVRSVRVDSTNPAELRGVDLLVVGCPTQGWRPTPTIQSFLEEISSERFGGLAAACFDTRFRFPRWITGSAADVMARKLQEKGISLLSPPESFFVRGTEGPLHGGELDRAATWARMLFEEVKRPQPAA